MVLRTILEFSPEFGVSEFQDSSGWSRMAKDGDKNHPRIFYECGVNFFKNASGWSEDSQGWSQGSSRMFFRVQRDCCQGHFRIV